MMCEQTDASCHHIEADTITVEIIDKKSGKMFRRTLPVGYTENANGIMLSGETIEGKPVQMAFYSDTALERINDLIGKGPDSPRCDHS